MATITHRYAGADTTNQDVYANGGAFTPAAGELLVVYVFGANTVLASPPLTSSVGGDTFTLADSCTFATSSQTLYVYVANQLATATSQTLTIDFTGDTAGGVQWMIAGVSGMTLTGSSAVRQTAKQNNQAGGTTPAPVFASSCQTENPTFCAVANASNPAALTPATGWTELAEQGMATPTSGSQYQGRNSGFTGTTITYGSTSATGFGSLAIELDFINPSVTAEAGTYTWTGVAAGLRVARRLTAEAGTYSLTGQAAGLRAARRVSAEAGTYTLTGQSATLTYTPSGGAYSLVAEAGTYTLSGVAAGLRVARRMTGGTGTYSLTGQAATLRAGRRLAAGTGTYSLTGVAAALRVARRLTAEAGSYAWTGVSAALTYSGALADLAQYLITLLGLDRFQLTDHTVTRYLITEDPMSTTTTSSAYLWLTEDQEADFEFQRKNSTTGVLEAATGLTGMTVHVAASAGGAAIGSLTFNLTERGTTGTYFAVMDTATMTSGLSAASYPDGTALYLVVIKSGDIASRSFRRIVKRQRIGDG